MAPDGAFADAMDPAGCGEAFREASPSPSSSRANASSRKAKGCPSVKPLLVAKRPACQANGKRGQQGLKAMKG